jgi:hypothetical protein
MGILGIWVAGGGWVRWRMAGGGVLVVGGQWVVVGVGGFGFREERDGGAVSGVLYSRRKNGGEGGKCDLKAGHKRPETEYLQTYWSTFDRTRAGAWVCVCMIRSNLQE